MRSISPLLLRIALAATFIWAGWGKLFSSAAFSPEQAAVLANLGVGAAQRAALRGEAPPPPPPETPAPEPLPEPRSEAFGRVLTVQNAVQSPEQNEVAGARVFQPADFAGPVTLPRRHFIALIIHKAANPPEGGLRACPAALGGEPWPSVMAWAVGLTELTCGVLLLVGLLTRLAALGVAVIMGVALWLVALAPARALSDAFLGFLPPLQNFDPGAWQGFLFKLILLCAALSLLITGAGAVSLDRLIGGRTSRRRAASHHHGADEDDDE